MVIHHMETKVQFDNHFVAHIKTEGVEDVEVTIIHHNMEEHCINGNINCKCNHCDSNNVAKNNLHQM